MGKRRGKAREISWGVISKDFLNHKECGIYTVSKSHERLKPGDDKIRIIF